VIRVDHSRLTHSRQVFGPSSSSAVNSPCVCSKILRSIEDDGACLRVSILEIDGAPHDRSAARSFNVILWRARYRRRGCAPGFTRVKYRRGGLAVSGSPGEIRLSASISCRSRIACPRSLTTMSISSRNLPSSVVVSRRISGEGMPL